MLTRIQIQRYKSLYDTTVDLEPLTVFIGPNGSGKSNICEALFIASQLKSSDKSFLQAVRQLFKSNDEWHNKFWHSDLQQKINFKLTAQINETHFYGSITIDNVGRREGADLPEQISQAIKRVTLYDFNPAYMITTGQQFFDSAGRGIPYILGKILYDDRKRFDELESQFIHLVPNIARISLGKDGQIDTLRLVDRYSEHRIPMTDISDGTLRILAFLIALYDLENPSIICFEEPENGVHPWLLHKMMELLNLVSTEGIGGKPVQVLITTHSPVLLNYVKPEQVRVVELDKEGKTQVHKLPTDSVRFRKAMEAYDHEVGELWFTNVIGGNPT